jgi:hypothetical protein
MAELRAIPRRSTTRASSGALATRGRPRDRAKRSFLGVAYEMRSSALQPHIRSLPLFHRTDFVIAVDVVLIEILEEWRPYALCVQRKDVQHRIAA